MRHARLLADYCAGVADECEPASQRENHSWLFIIGDYTWYGWNVTNHLRWVGETLWPVDYGRNVQGGDGPWLADWSKV